MMRRVMYDVDPSSIEKVKELALKWRGKYPTIQPTKKMENGYIKQDVVFESIEDMNKFIYNCYMSVGYHFIVEFIGYAQYVF